ncbi:MAG: exodeoxyribonuclease VII large subunit [Gemmatimonadetes bacterium]|nr:exodeoxyribonuclease VII large subunit [Gemmatimonadota bacterium]
MQDDLFSRRPPALPGRRGIVRGPAGWSVGASGEPPTWPVSAVNAMARSLLESGIPMLWVHGEVTGWKRQSNGHCYFTLRDERSQLRAAMFRLEAQRLPADPEEGMKVRALGTVTLYEKRGDFQLRVQQLEATQEGGLWRLRFERLREKLDAEGLFAPLRKRPIPGFPATVGVVTSPVGAALQDILRVIRTRAPWIRIVLSPARVQGEGAGLDIARAIHTVARSGLADVIIVGRGGGSVEDLWAFNEEVVARAIVASAVPVISAVGHETDVTIADLVADLRASTPSAAAERAVPDGPGLARELARSRDRLQAALRRTLATRRAMTDDAAADLRAAGAALITRPRERLASYARRLEALSPLGALARGFAVPLSEDQRILRDVTAFEIGAAFRLRVTGGDVGCRVTDTRPAKDGRA